MKTLYYPRITSLSLVSLAAVGVSLFAWESRDKLPAGFPFAAVERSVPREIPKIATQLPFTFEDVTKYFQESLAHPPQEKRFNYAVFRSGDGIDYFYTVAISSSGPDLLVKFQVVDDYGMNIVREFFEAPFIQRKESKQLHALLYMGSGIRTINLPRFVVVFEYDNRSESTTVSLMFSPHSRYVSTQPRAN